MRKRIFAVILSLICAGCHAGNTSETDVTDYSSIVVYFSGTGNTEKVAQQLAEITDSDLYEIIPEELYTEEDLDYTDDNSRANLEMEDETARPAIVLDEIDFDSYDVVYLGYPIWWGTLPRIMNTFLDTYDLSGKVIAPFCTSGGSGIANAVEVIAQEEPDADIREGLRISSAEAEDCSDALNTWLKTIELQ